MSNLLWRWVNRGIILGGSAWIADMIMNDNGEPLAYGVAAIIVIDSIIELNNDKAKEAGR